LKAFIGVLLFLTVVVMASSALGVIQPEIPSAFSIDAPSGGGGGILDTIKGAIAPILYVFSAVTAFVQLLLFRVEGVPSEVNALLIIPVLGGIFYMIIRVIRGGG